MAMAVDRRTGVTGEDVAGRRPALASISSSSPPLSSPFAAAVQGGLALRLVPPSLRNVVRNGGVA
ncbi:hypothetical protein E2562_026219 [Oryza meyeriana var. granulata]|uniref:Uncharacterized protein n=1 Tax=Oryza meyeriana var. granulata TaxID=110450 RepID=A0A6G1E227_9ORYZ|nr:hypothetical protein E2562_026219 [Oryza meyeriana var. granulata]